VIGAGGFLTAKVNIGDVLKGMAAMERRCGALGDAFRKLRKPMSADQKDHGKRQAGPFGAWARRAPSTLAAYRAKGKRAPRPMGRLPRAISYTSDQTAVRGASRVRWSDAHMTGATVGRGVRLKARPFMWLSRSLLDVAEETIGRVLVVAYGGR
jgi:phage gpG-like protein